MSTLLEGAGYTFNIFECDFQSFILLWCKKAVKLDENGLQSNLSASTIDGKKKKGQSASCFIKKDLLNILFCSGITMDEWKVILGTSNVIIAQRCNS